MNHKVQIIEKEKGAKKMGKNDRSNESISQRKCKITERENE